MSDLLRAPAGPLPAVSAVSAFFWHAGQRGELEILRCQRCRFYVHPPKPLCRRCLSPDLAPEVVSGRGVVAAFTINHHPWLPGLQHYTLALVDLEEQAELRLVTNIVGCAEDEVHIGMPVTVAFEQREDVWLPLFTKDMA